MDLKRGDKIQGAISGRFLGTIVRVLPGDRVVVEGPDGAIYDLPAVLVRRIPARVITGTTVRNRIWVGHWKSDASALSSEDLRR